jgi:hypothetical protein
MHKYVNLPCSRENKYKVSACILKTHTNSQNCYEIRVKFPFRHSFALVDRFSPVYSTFMARFGTTFPGSRVAFGKTIRVTGGYRKVETSSRKRVLVKFSQLM